MKALIHGFGALLVGGLLTAGCGGSSSDSSKVSGGSGNSGATAANGGNGVATGGSDQTTGGSDQTSGGSADTTGGTDFGTGGTGGAAVNAATCPPESPTPATGDPCTLATMTGGIPAGCVYGTNTCYCAPAFGGGGASATGSGTLYCAPTPVPPTACSDTAATGDACTAGCLVPNNGGYCFCTMGALACQPPFMGFGGGSFGFGGGSFGFGGATFGGPGGSSSGGGTTGGGAAGGGGSGGKAGSGG
ncbi:MAG: hypothetical protein WDO74_05480 [Pseudomonadota bacterium]